MNTPKSIDRVLLSLGFAKRSLLLNGDPSYLSVNAATFRAACALKVLIEPDTAAGKVHIIGVYAA